MEEETEESQTLSIATKLVHPKTSVEPVRGVCLALPDGDVRAAERDGKWTVTASGNPSRDQLEEQLNVEEARAFAFSSDMALAGTDW